MEDAAMNIEEPMRILMISAEGPPLLHAGALIDVMDALPRELRAHGHEVALALPYYREIRENPAFKEEDTGVTVDVRVGDKTYIAEYLQAHSTSGVQLFLIRCDEFFDREGIYGEHGVAYEDNAARFIFFNKAAVELARRLTPTPQVLHVHDWAAALVPVYVKAHRLPFSTVLTIHHVADQGSFWGLDFRLTNLPERFFTLRGVEFFGKLNFLKGGILFADNVTTVSEHYRREIQSAEGGCGLDVVLRENSHKLSAILHGADYTRWNPETDKLLPANYTPDDLWGKELCRGALLNGLRLDQEPKGPVFGMVTRVVGEKGFDILVPVLDRLLSDDVRLVILGEGDPVYETALAVATRKYPTKFAYRSSYDEKSAHVFEAGMDISLIPSRFEPSGLSAMYSLKYGALPVARTTGGIQEIIEDYDPWSDNGYGFLCYEYSTEAFWDAIKRARDAFRDQDLWAKLRARAMARNFSGEAAAERYEQLYREISTLHEAAAA
ncbi:MAG TPA: glycogen/starch synthase [Chthoniobacterales bacterium]|nr:glycogen/starch synthase [Chthoniobacterales bacterium]